LALRSIKLLRQYGLLQEGGIAVSTELIPDHLLYKTLGAINTGILYSSYLSDLKKYNLSFNGAISWKIARGL
jgi:hypothetical protein